MSLRFPSRLKWASAASILVFGLGAGNVFAQSVQSYVEQAVPDTSMSSARYNSPLAAGTLTLRDVLEAHKTKQEDRERSLQRSAKTTVAPSATAPVMASPAQSSTTGMMLSEGMRAVLQKVGDNAVTKQPTKMRSPKLETEATTEPVALTAPSLAAAAASAAVPAAAAPVAQDGVAYVPGQEPKNLSAVLSGNASPSSVAAGIVEQSAPAPAAADVVPLATSTAPQGKAAAACDQNVRKWQKTCAEAGYPASFVGRIDGETRTDCAKGTLQDFWVANSCAPASEAAAEPAPSVAAAIVDKDVAKSGAVSAPAAAVATTTPPVVVDGACGPSADQTLLAAPSRGLCDHGTPSGVSGAGPWTWACSGINGGQPIACTAHKRVEAVDAACGSANGHPVERKPSADLCDIGTASQVRGGGPWTWTCKGAGEGRSQSCIAPKAAPAVVERAPERVAEPVRETPHETAAPAPAPKAAVVESAPRAAASTSAEADLCGLAAETLAAQMPDKDLCRAGSPSVVNGDGPWSWSCTDNEGNSSTCRTLSLTGDAPVRAVAPAPAPVASRSAAAEQSVVARRPVTAARAVPVESEPVSAQCGLAAAHAAPTAPSVELCDSGKPSAVRGSGPWRWTCAKGKSKVSCETPVALDGACGPANGMALTSAPFAGLCSAGRPSGITGDGPWSWTCGGSGGGVSVSCAAAPVGKIEGSCGTAANMTFATPPSGNLCADGTPSPVKANDNNFTWSCSGSNGGAVSSCSAPKAKAPPAPGPKMDGLCGFADGAMALSEPLEGLCSRGTATAVVGHGPWNWNCVGDNGGITVSCTAPLEPPAPIDGTCGSANGVPTLVKPVGGLCAAGVTGRVSGSGPWTWTCSGANGGAPASCIAPMAGKGGGAMPSLTTPSVSSTPVEAAPAPASELSTPRLPAASAETIPALDKKALPSLTSPKLAGRAKPSSVPAPTTLDGQAYPAAAPAVSDTSRPLTPPSTAISSAPALQEETALRTSRIPGNRLELDPTISTILFTRGSGNIDEKVLPTLNKLVAVLSASPDARVTLVAYADVDDTTPRGARRLSLNRALAVRDYLTAKGLSESRIDVRAEGANTATGYTDRVDVKVND